MVRGIGPCIADRLGGSEAILICRKCVLNCLPGASHNKVNIQPRCQRGWVAEWLRHPTSNLETRVQFPAELHFHSCNQLSRFPLPPYINKYIYIFVMFRCFGLFLCYFQGLYVMISIVSPENPRVSAISAPSGNFSASSLVSHFTCKLKINNLVKKSSKKCKSK